MSARLLCCVSFVGVALLPGAAVANGLVIPGIGPEDSYNPRPSYRQAYNDFPPPQHDFLGQPVASGPIDARPSYRQAYNDFPPPQHDFFGQPLPATPAQAGYAPVAAAAPQAPGSMGGGFVEYMMTGAAPGAEATATGYAAPAPAYAASVNPYRSALPRSGLPDYAPQPPAYYGAAPAAYTASAYSASAQGAGTLPFASAAPVVYATPGAAYDPVAADPGMVSRPLNPVYYRQMVAYSGRERPGTIVIDTPNKFLYLVRGGGQAIRYGIGVGRPGFTWRGNKTISRKAEWPGWTPPREMLARRPDLPRHMDGGEANPLGARALYLGSSMYRIHGTNEPYTIGTNVSSGCIRMMNNDVIDLYGRVGVGTRVLVM